MNKFSFLLLAVFASNGAFASETGASFSQLSNSTAVAAVAITDTGVKSSGRAVKAEQPTAYNRDENALGEIAAELKLQILKDAESLVEHKLTETTPDLDSLERF